MEEKESLGAVGRCRKEGKERGYVVPAVRCSMEMGKRRVRRWYPRSLGIVQDRASARVPMEEHRGKEEGKKNGDKNDKSLISICYLYGS